mmetsp:Transcript_116729/g.326529  ORF Transcript_116729/g.326529 Transcript_116729/m.326529 type:complete len:130 (+) Transcript_116729:11-400(+)
MEAEERGATSSWGDNDSLQSPSAAGPRNPEEPGASHRSELDFLRGDLERSDACARSKSELNFLRYELDGCYKNIEELRKSLSSEESAAYLQRERAESKDREVNHLRTQLRRFRRGATAGVVNDDKGVGG